MKSVVLALLSCFVLSLSACEKLPVLPEQEQQQGQKQPDNNDQQSGSKENQAMAINITAGGKTFTADIEDAETGKAFLAKLPLTLEMSELNGNEKYCYGVELPRADKHYNSISSGDLMLYSGNCVVLFYGSAGGYSYTRIGKLTSTDGLKEALGTGNISVTFAKQ